MARPCCAGGTALRRLAQRFSGAAASILPAAALVFLPKCPLCLAAWLTVATGIGISTATAAWLREALFLCSVAAAALLFVSLRRRRRNRITG